MRYPKALVFVLACICGFAVGAGQALAAEGVSRGVGKALVKGCAVYEVPAGVCMDVQQAGKLVDRARYAHPNASLCLKCARVDYARETCQVTRLRFTYRNRIHCKKLRKAVRRITRKLRSGMTNARKYRIIHDCIVRRCSYDTRMQAAGRAPAQSYTAYGCLVGKRALCSGYARAFQLVARCAGLPALYASSGTHAWNVVKARGRWYQVDAAWDDMLPTAGKRYFLRGARFMGKTGHHVIWRITPYRPKLAKRDYQ